MNMSKVNDDIFYFYLEILIILMIIGYYDNTDRFEYNFIFLSILLFSFFSIYKITKKNKINFINLNIDDEQIKNILGIDYFNLNNESKIDIWKKYFQNIFMEYDNFILNLNSVSSYHMLIQIKMILQKFNYEIIIGKINNEFGGELIAWNPKYHNFNFVQIAKNLNK